MSWNKGSAFKRKEIIMQRTAQLFLLALFSFVLSGLAQAQSVATFVSAKTGSDSGTCTTALPCRNLTYALTQTQTGGVITMVDSGDYAPTAITKAITIQAAPGVEAVITSGSLTGLSIVAGASSFVTLRGLMFEGQGTAGFGIQSTNSGGVQIENCIVRNYTSMGIQLTGNAGKHSISNTIVQHCANGIGVGIVTGTNSVATVLIEGCRVEKNTNIGISIAANGTGNKIRAALFNTSAINNGAHGFSASGNSGGATDMTLDSCIALQNGTGINSAPSCTTRVSNMLVMSNAIGMNGAAILTRGNNTIKLNDNGNTFGGTYGAK
jgi:Right handed beta helix region